MATIHFDTKDLGPNEAKVIGSFNVSGYDNLNDLTKATGMRREDVEKAVHSLIARGMVTPRGAGWRNRLMPNGLMTDQYSNPIRNVFYCVNLIYDIIQREAKINSDWGVSDALKSLRGVALKRQERKDIRLSGLPPAMVLANNMLLVVEVDAHHRNEVRSILRNDKMDDPSIASQVSGKKTPGKQFAEMLRSLEALDTTLRKHPDSNMDFRFSGALYDLCNILEHRQQRLKPNGKANGLAKAIIVSEVNRYDSWSRITDIGHRDAHAEYVRNGGTLVYEPWLFGGTPFGLKA